MLTPFILVLLFLVIVGAPLFVIMGSATALSFYWFTDDHGTLDSLLVILQATENLVTRQEFLAIPLFMASGAIMTTGGIASRLVTIARAGLGWLPGGVAVASVIACIFFAAISGSSPVTLIAVGSIMFPAMIKSGYGENFSLGLVTTAGSLGCLVPPSLAMLIYAISISASTAKVNPQDMFLAGLVPALFIGGLLCAYAVWTGLRTKVAREPFEWAKLKAALLDGIWALALPFVVLGGIYGGFFNPSEAGAVATVYALFVTMGVYRELDGRKLMRSLIESASLMGTLILIIVLSFGLNEFLNDIQLNEKLIGWIRDMQLGPFGFMMLVNVILIVLGALMDSISCTLIFAPILAPVAWEVYGIDPLHFGVVFVVNMEIGYLAPPVATNLFVSAAVFKKPFGQVVRAVMPTLGITIAALIVIMYVPTISKGVVNWRDDRPIIEGFPWDGKPVAVRTSTGPATDIGSLTDQAMDELDAALEDDPTAPAVDPTAPADPDDDPYGVGGGKAPAEAAPANPDDDPYGMGDPAPAKGAPAAPKPAGDEKPAEETYDF
ncbi:MAG: TRAP transporter large permease [Myxococcales bacterium]|nr:TRAP transporter large permease [Myxococcales bacterium]